MKTITIMTMMGCLALVSCQQQQQQVEKQTPVLVLPWKK